MDMKRMGTRERKILRRICAPVADQGIQRIKTNQEMMELYKDLHIVADIIKKRLEWTGHEVRMDHRRTVKKIFESKLEGRKRRGRQMLRRIYRRKSLRNGD
jgi:hypothetical protein